MCGEGGLTNNTNPVDVYLFSAERLGSSSENIKINLLTIRVNQLLLGGRLFIS